MEGVSSPTRTGGWSGRCVGWARRGVSLALAGGRGSSNAPGWVTQCRRRNDPPQRAYGRSFASGD